MVFVRVFFLIKNIETSEMADDTAVPKSDAQLLVELIISDDHQKMLSLCVKSSEK